MSFLQSTLSVLTSNIQKLEAELGKDGGAPSVHLWEPSHYDKLDDVERYVPRETFDLIDKIRIDLDAIHAAVTPTRLKHLALGLSALKSSALHVAASVGISDAIQDLGGEAALPELAKHLSVNENKLGRIIKLLATEFIYRETTPGVFANTRHSMTLLKKQNSEPFLSLAGYYGTISAAGLFKNITDPDTKDSFEDAKAPFCSTVSSNGETFVEYIMQPEHADIAAKVAQGVVPWLNRITRPPLIHGFPWDEYGHATVIDVGSGPGDSGIDLLRQYPNLRWVFQDLAPVIDGLRKSFPEDLKHRAESGDIQFVIQDYFEPNTSQGEVWYLRGVIHEYDTDGVLKILNNVTTGMRKTPGARLLLNEIMISTISTAPESKTLGRTVPSEHVPASQSAVVDVANLMTWNTFCFFGGYERSFSETEDLLRRAGLRLNRFFKLSSFTVMLEAVLI